MRIVSKTEINLQFPYAVPAQYEHLTAADSKYKNKIIIALNVAKLLVLWDTATRVIKYNKDRCAVLGSGIELIYVTKANEVFCLW